MNDLVAFCEQTNAFDNNSRLKALLFALGAKPNTYVHLRITDNLHDKHRFEYLLHKHKILFTVSRPKGFEEITKATGDKAHWEIAGVWYGYDLFHDSNAKKNFARAVSLLKKQKHEEADRILGKHYGYPSCCVQAFIDEHDPKAIAKKYRASEYYTKLQTLDRTFPFLTHTACSASCAVSTTINRMYENTLRKYAPAFFKKYSSKRSYRMQVAVDADNDIVPFKNPDAHDYTVITLEPLEGHYQLISWLTPDKHERGTIITATLTLCYDYAIITQATVVKKGRGFHHERHFLPHI